jgi:hypothetical protein
MSLVNWPRAIFFLDQFPWPVHQWQTTRPCRKVQCRMDLIKDGLWGTLKKSCWSRTAYKVSRIGHWQLLFSLWIHHSSDPEDSVVVWLTNSRRKPGQTDWNYDESCFSWGWKMVSRYKNI